MYYNNEYILLTTFHFNKYKCTMYVYFVFNIPINSNISYLSLFLPILHVTFFLIPSLFHYLLISTPINIFMPFFIIFLPYITCHSFPPSSSLSLSSYFTPTLPQIYFHAVELMNFTECKTIYVKKKSYVIQCIVLYVLLCIMTLWMLELRKTIVWQKFVNSEKSSTTSFCLLCRWLLQLCFPSSIGHSLYDSSSLPGFGEIIPDVWMGVGLSCNFKELFKLIVPFSSKVLNPNVFIHYRNYWGFDYGV